MMRKCFPVFTTAFSFTLKSVLTPFFPLDKKLVFTIIVIFDSNPVRGNSGTTCFSQSDEKAFITCLSKFR